MPIDFPSSPTTGQQYTYAGVTYTYTAQGVWASGGSTGYTASITAPTSPVPGDHWYDLSSGLLSIFINDGNSSQWVLVSPPLAPDVTSLVPEHGRLTYVSATQLAFKPFRGDTIKINGAFYQIPAAGIAGLTNGGLAANTTYYVYAYNNAGVITGEFSTTGHVTSSTVGNSGVETKSGDDTRTLIGMIRTNASSQFVDTAANRFVISWFNRRAIQLTGINVSIGGITATSYVELNSGARINFVNWAEEAVAAGYAGFASANGITNAQATIYLDNIQSQMVMGPLGTIVSSGYAVSLAGTCSFNTSEGFHSLSLYGSTSAVTASFNIFCTAVIRG
jgi:hypothetical protein